MRRRKRRWPLYLFLLAAAGGGAWWYQERQKAAGAQLPEYETVTIARGDLTKVVSATGELNPLVKVEIGSQISGTIARLHVDFNSAVKEGDVLCELDPATYEANFAQAKAERTSAEAERDLQRRNLDRKQQLVKRELLAVAEFDKVESDLRRAEAQLELVEARLKKASVDLERCRILAPINGVVVDRTAEVGQTIAASFSAPKLFVMAADLTKMQINAKVSEADIGQVTNGQKVKFIVDAYPDPFMGEVVQVRNSPIAEENVVNYDVIIAVDNPELKLKPGMTATVQIITGERQSALRVPNGALRFRPASKGQSAGGGQGGGGGGGGGPGPSRVADPAAAFKSKADTGEKTLYKKPSSPQDEPVPLTVKTGLSDGVNTEILSGISEGDEVILLMKPKRDGGGGPASNPFGGMGRR